MADRRKAGTRAAWFLGGTVLSIAVVFVALRNPDEPLTPDALRAAKAQWKASGPKSYTLEVDVGGDLHLIRVRDGEVVDMTIGGADAPGDARAYWSVEGMFGFLQAELENASDPQRTYGVSDPSRVILRATFDAELGFPRRFFRHVLGHGAGIQWEVRRFIRE